MEEHINKLASYINKLKDFEFLNVSSSYTFEIGETLSLSKDRSRNLTYNNMGATLIDGILQAGLNYKNVVKPRVDNFKKHYSQIKVTIYELGLKKNFKIPTNLTIFKMNGMGSVRNQFSAGD